MLIKEERYTRNILNTIRKSALLKEEDEKKQKEFPITKKTPHFGDVRTSQEEELLKTIGETIEYGEKALIYYPDNKSLVLNGKITSLNLAFQFKYPDSSGDGCYLWANALQLTEANNRTVGKIRDAYVNWKQNLIQNGDLMERLEKESKEQ